MPKLGVSKKDSLHHQILHQNPGQGYIALFQIISHHHPVIGKHPHLLICSLPVQLAFETVAQHFQHYSNYINLRAILEENHISPDQAFKLEKFLAGLTHSQNIFIISQEKLHLNDPQIKQKFTQGAIINTLSQYLDNMNLTDGPPHYLSTCYYDFNSDSDLDILTRASPSHFTVLKGSARTSSLQRFVTSSNNNKKKKVRLANCIQVDLKGHLASLVIPNDLEINQLFRVHMYEAGINVVKRDATKFIDGMDCAICDKKHSFDQCPILNDIPYIKKHSILYCLQMNKTQKQMLAAIQCIDAT